MIVRDGEYVTLAATGDAANEYLWFNQHGDYLGSGQTIRARMTRYGDIDIILKTLLPNGTCDVVTKPSVYTTQIHRAEKFFDRVDAQIALTGGVLTQAYKDAVCNFVSTLYNTPTIGYDQAQTLFDHAFWHPVLPVSLEVALLEFQDTKPSQSGDADMNFRAFNTPTIQNNFLYCNGIDNFIYIDQSLSSMIKGYNGFILSYVGTNTETGGEEWSTARNNNSSRLEFTSLTTGKLLQPAGFESNIQNNQPFGKGNIFAKPEILDGVEGGIFHFYAGESNDVVDSIATYDYYYQALYAATNQGLAVGLGQGFVTGSDPSTYATLVEVEFGGIFHSSQVVSYEAEKYINQAWEQYHADLGRAVTYN